MFALHQIDRLSPTSARRLRRWVLIALAAGIWYSSTRTAQAEDAARPVVTVERSQPYEQHGILIRPAPTRQLRINGVSYSDVYDSIPLHRADALAHPGYRHDATMEILFGELRPTTIVRHESTGQTVPTRVAYVPAGLGTFGYRSTFPYLSSYGLHAYRWSVWDNYLYRRPSWMFFPR